MPFAVAVLPVHADDPAMVVTTPAGVILRTVHESAAYTFTPSLSMAHSC